MADLLAETLNIIKVHRRAGKDECKVPASKLIGDVLNLLQREGYLKGFEFVKDSKGGFYTVNGLGPINDCAVVNPRFAIKQTQIADVEEQYLPSKDFGIVIISTPKGLVTNKEIRELKSGGRLIAYVY